MKSSKKYKVINSSKVVFTGLYTDAMDQCIAARNSIIVSVDGEWVIAQCKRGVFSVIDEPHKYVKPARVTRQWVAKFTALESFYGAGNMSAGESCTAGGIYAATRNEAMRQARAIWRDTNGGPQGVKAKISVKLA